MWRALVVDADRLVPQLRGDAFPSRATRRDLGVSAATARPAPVIELCTLGALELRGADGRQLKPILQQPKRFALLVYLALSSPRRFHRRDSLLALFWPESDADRARAALRRSLYFLRRALGEGVLVARGDEEIGLAEGAIITDVERFEEAASHGRFVEALDIYRGQLLEGFFVSNAAEFERWLDAERVRLHEHAVTVAWTLATEQERAGASREAAHVARRAVSMTPHDEGAHRRLMTLLANSGDRAAALRTFDDFTRRLQTDYGIAPEPQTHALAQAIRDGSVVSTTSAPMRAGDPGQHAPAAPGDALTQSPVAGAPAQPSGQPASVGPVSGTDAPVAIAVFPFTVRGSRELAYLGDGVVDLLSTLLDGAGAYRTVDPRALLSLIAREELRDPDPATAAGAARRFGARVFVLGSIMESGRRLRVTTTIYDDSARALGTAEVEGGGEGELFDLIDDVARRLLAAVSRESIDRLARLAARTTSSLPALKAYLRGECEFRSGRYFQALEEYQNAAAEDTTFALAYYRLAAAAAAVANLALAREAAEQALAHRARLGEHDRLLVEAQRAWLYGDADEAESLYRAVIATHVDDMEAWFLLGDVLFHHNPLRGRSIADAREPFERALEYDPAHVSSLVHLARLAAFDGDRPRLDDLATRVLALSPVGDRALSIRALRAFTLRNEVEKIRVITALGRARGIAVGIAFTDIVLYARDYDGAHRLAELFARLSRGKEEKALCQMVIAHLDLAGGRRDAANRALSEVQKHDLAWGLECRALLAALPFLPVTKTELEGLRAELTEWNATGTTPNRNQVLAVHNGLHPMLRSYLIGLLSARLGDRDGAMGAHDDIARSHEGAGHRPAAVEHEALRRALQHSIRAYVSHRERRFAEALQELDGAPTSFWYQLSILSPFYGRALDRFLRAECLRELGRELEAEGWYASLGRTTPYELVYLSETSDRVSTRSPSTGRRGTARPHPPPAAGG